jgi:hypothetical protein
MGEDVRADDEPVPDGRLRGKASAVDDGFDRLDNHVGDRRRNARLEG